MSKTGKPINLALQGGGAHGAFSWGVLDYLLEDGRLRIAGVSGTSAGAMNAVALADGFTRAGPNGARAALDHFWRCMSGSVKNSPMQRTPLDRLTGNWGLENNPFYHFMNALTGVASPYQLNPMNINPLRDLVEESIDFDMVRKCTAFELFVSATNVETGRVKVFAREELTADMVMASACLPQLYQAVEIDGVPYWDGGYMGNPALFPLYGKTGTDDIVVIQINPIERKGAPRSAQDIQNRMNEISFNASLLKELRAIDFVDRLIAQDKLSTEHYRPVKVHLIENEAALKPMGASSKMNVEWAFLTRLRDIGRDTAAAWLDANYDRIGKESTIDLRAMFQGIGAEHQG
ncbi:putative esterase of the alpha-beta hydrolase superfamily [Roseovarius mucosus DSM 17069]|uniref:Putative esterase of the alpha-beta hydrolase superfamily n=1 Tax=Roseovarius mucosus DSM 17069 TaxID=1288298 RepID=A0A0A0HLE8_9RHOB|nr:patatin-like phospholipase family protein [Roseovarius mucosus]KGM87746.1 putative esterase of the alpha-beta hydrolase superfamily [Roseovarius mucosus DSM 17069]